MQILQKFENRENFISFVKSKNENIFNESVMLAVKEKEIFVLQEKYFSYANKFNLNFKLYNSWYEFYYLEPIQSKSKNILFYIPVEKLAYFVSEANRISTHCQWQIYDKFAIVKCDNPSIYSIMKMEDYVFWEQSENLWVQYNHKHLFPEKVQKSLNQIILVNHKETIYLNKPNFNQASFKESFANVNVSKCVNDYKVIMNVEIKLKDDKKDNPFDLILIKNKYFEDFVSNISETLLEKIHYTFVDDYCLLKTAKNKLPQLQIQEAIGLVRHNQLYNLYIQANKKIYPNINRQALSKIFFLNDDKITILINNLEIIKFNNNFKKLSDYIDHTVDNKVNFVNSKYCKYFNFPKFDLIKEYKEEIFVQKESKKTYSSAKMIPVDTSEEKVIKVKPLPIKEVKKQVINISISEWKKTKQTLEKYYIDNYQNQIDLSKFWKELGIVNKHCELYYQSNLCFLNSLWINFDKDVLKEMMLLNVGKECINEKEFDSFKDDPNKILSVFICCTKEPWAVNKLDLVKEIHEKNDISVKLSWLFAKSLYENFGQDVLAVTRIRDNVFCKIFNYGLSKKLDILDFVKFNNNDKFLKVKNQLDSIYDVCYKWIDRSINKSDQFGANYDNGYTKKYLNLFTAYAYSKLKDKNKVDYYLNLNKEEKSDNRFSISYNALRECLLYRINNSFEESDISLYNNIQLKINNFSTSKNVEESEAFFAIKRLQEQSLIVQPEEKVNIQTYYSNSRKEISNILISNENKPEKLYNVLIHTLNNEKSNEDKLLLLIDVMLLGIKIGDTLSKQLIDKALNYCDKKYDNIQLIKLQCQLIEKTLILAANYNNNDIVNHLIERFIYLISNNRKVKLDIINIISNQCLKCLKKLGYKDKIISLYDFLYEELNQPDGSLKYNQALLNVASGLLIYDKKDRALLIIKEAKSIILSKNTYNLMEFNKFLKSYIFCINHLDINYFINDIKNILEKIDNEKVVNSYSTSNYYSRLHINILEEIILSLISEDIKSNSIIDIEEYLIRKQINNDIRNYINQSF